MSNLVRITKGAICVSAFFAAVTTPLGYVALLGAIAGYVLFFVLFVLAKKSDKLPRRLSYTYREFIAIWVLAALLWYPMWLGCLFLFLWLFNTLK